MAVTCRDVMELDACSQLKLLGGKEGLDRTVRWTYIKSMDTISEWVHGHELIFVIGNKEDVSENGLLQLMEEAVKNDIAGVVLLQGEDYIKRVPKSVIHYADEHKIPLFKLPFRIRLIDITQEISKFILTDQERNHEHGMYTENSLLELLMEKPEKERILDYCWMKLQPLTEADKVMRTEYVKTLRCYLENNNDLLHTSQKMYIHRNTMVNRMKKITALLGCDVNDCEVRSEYYNIFKTLEYYGQFHEKDEKI